MTITLAVIDGKLCLGLMHRIRSGVKRFQRFASELLTLAQRQTCVSDSEIIGNYMSPVERATTPQ